MIDEQELLNRFERVTESEGVWSARCPAHDDRESALSIWQDDNVNWRLECRSGCPIVGIADAVGIAMSELSPEQVVRYRYDSFFEVVRIGSDDVRRRRSGGPGRWTFDMTGVEPRLYRLNDLRKANPGARGQPAIVVERETDANWLWSIGGQPLPATCNFGGLGRWEETYIAQLKGAGVRDVAVVPDGDPRSRAHAAEVAAACHAAGLRVQLVALPDSAKDLSAYLADGHGGAELAPLIAAAPLFTGPVPTRLSEVTPEPVSWLWPGWIPHASVTVLEGNAGVGKGLIAFDLAARVSTGRPMPDGRPGMPQPAGVVLVTCDDASRIVRPRLDVAGADVAQILHVPRDGGGVPTATELAAIDGAVCAHDAKLVVVAPLVPAIRRPPAANSGQDVRDVLASLGRLAARRGAAILVTRDLDPGEAGERARRGEGIGDISGVWSRLTAGPDPAGVQRNVLRRAKSPPSTPGESLSYELVVYDDGVLSIVWRESTPPHALEPSPSSAHLSQGASAFEIAVEFLRGKLADGPLPASDVQEAAVAVGISIPTLRRAKRLLKVQSEKQGQPGSDAQWWSWRLPRK